jgi:hypothetical protein
MMEVAGVESGRTSLQDIVPRVILLLNLMHAREYVNTVFHRVAACITEPGHTAGHFEVAGKTGCSGLDSGHPRMTESQCSTRFSVVSVLPGRRGCDQVSAKPMAGA